MNKRQQKKAKHSRNHRLVKVYRKFDRAFWDRGTSEMRWHLLPHRRRHWFSRVEFKRRKDAYKLALQLAKQQAIEANSFQREAIEVLTSFSSRNFT